MFSQNIIKISLDAAGLIAIADLQTIANRTAITGSASFLDILALAPGIHKHQEASVVNGGELPPTAALTSGYVFRTENQATVSYFQKLGQSGKLVNLVVAPSPATGRPPILRLRAFLLDTGLVPTILYLLAPVLSLASMAILATIQDWWGLGSLLALVLARLVNVIVIRRRSKMGWKGRPEPGVHGDLLVLISQDRWIRIKGQMDDLKAVTSGQWLRNSTSIEGFVAAGATLTVYLTAALAGNASRIGSVIILALLLVSSALIGLSNEKVTGMKMYGRIIRVIGEPKPYERRLDLMNELVEETGRDDWAIGLGMKIPDTGDARRAVL